MMNNISIKSKSVEEIKEQILSEDANAFDGLNNTEKIDMIFAKMIDDSSHYVIPGKGLLAMMCRKEKGTTDYG